MPDEKPLEDLLVDAHYDGYFAGRALPLLNAPPEIALPALKRLAGVRGSALAWMRFRDAYTYLLYTNHPDCDAGGIARRFPSGEGTKEIGTWTASKLLVSF